MKGKWMLPGLCLLLIGSLSGCTGSTNGRELEETVLARVIAVDKIGGTVVISAVGTDGNGENVTQAAAGQTVEEALSALPVAGERYLSLTNVTQILLGDGVNLQQVLEYVIQKQEMTYTITIWAVNGFAGVVLGETEDGGVGRFQVLKKSGVEGVTVKSALADLYNDGKTALPVLTVQDGCLQPVGTLHFEVM